LREAFSLTLTLSLGEGTAIGTFGFFRQRLPPTQSLVSRQDGERFSLSQRERAG
jgi:hypothetical protein